MKVGGRVGDRNDNCRMPVGSWQSYPTLYFNLIKMLESPDGEHLIDL